MLPMSENGLFWNVYEQECRFKGVEVKPPRHVRATCDKLATFYPDWDEAEMFMRAQFTTSTAEIGYYLPELVLSFKDFVMARHHRAYRERLRWASDNVAWKIRSALEEIDKMKKAQRRFDEYDHPLLASLLEQANVSLSDVKERDMEALAHLPDDLRWDIFECLPVPVTPSTTPLVRYLMEKEDCPWEYLERLAIECLHAPLLMEALESLKLTDSLEERIRFYKDEVRGIGRARHSGNPRYRPIDLSDI